MAEDFLSQLKAFEGVSLGDPETGPDAVNAPMIRHWAEAMGDTNPVYTSGDAAADAGFGPGGVVAPPTMLQAWNMRGFKPRPATGGSPNDALMRLLDSEGFTSVVATNCDQEYVRALRPGDVISEAKTIEAVSEEKATGLGVGHFVTTRSTYYDQDGEVVGTMLFRILKFRPKPKAEAAPARMLRPRPSVTHDNKWWFDACKEHKLLIQRCSACGVLRHPTRPMCSACGSFEWEGQEASGKGVVYSFVVNHYPQVPAFDYPLPIGLIELEEGTRLIAELTGAPVEAWEVGQAVELVWADHDPDLTLPQFKPAAG